MSCSPPPHAQGSRDCTTQTRVAAAASLEGPPAVAERTRRPLEPHEGQTDSKAGGTVPGFSEISPDVQLRFCFIGALSQTSASGVSWWPWESQQVQRRTQLATSRRELGREGLRQHTSVVSAVLLSTVFAEFREITSQLVPPQCASHAPPGALCVIQSGRGDRSRAGQSPALGTPLRASRRPATLCPPDTGHPPSPPPGAPQPRTGCSLWMV